MGEHNLESGKKVGRKEMESTPQESAAMSQYIDLRARAYNPLISDEERKNFAQDLIDAVKRLNEGKGIDPAVREDLLQQIQTLDKNYVRIKKAAEAVGQLERESRRGILAPHLYEKAVGLVKAALDGGVPESSLAPLEKSIKEYLSRVQSQSASR